jgi:hypothetical protein
MSLVKAETSKTHLEQRVEELSRRLQGDAERLAVFERRSSAVNGATHHVGEGRSQERELDVEVADLRYVACYHLVNRVLHALSLVVRSGWPNLTWPPPVIMSNNSRRSVRPVKRHWRH